MVSLALFLLAGTGLLASKKLLGDYFSPPAIYNFFWAFSLGALALNWVEYHPVGELAWTAIGLSYLGFMSGCLLITFFAFTRPNAWLRKGHDFQRLSRSRFELILLIFFGIGILGFLIQLIHLQSSIGLGTFANDPQRAREMHTNVRYIGLLNLLNVANFALTVFYFTVFKKPKWWFIFILLAALFTTFLTTDRTRFFYMVIWSFYTAMYCFRRVNLTPKMIAAGIAVVLGLFGFFILIAKIYVKQAYHWNKEFINLPKEYEFVVDPYIYLTGSYPVLQAFLEDEQMPAMGKNSFSPLITLLETVDDRIEREELVGKFYQVPIDLNATTYLEPFYKDFGFTGVFIMPTLLGLLCMGFYLYMRTHKNLFTVYTMGILSFCTTISIFVNHYVQLATWFFIAAGYIAYRFSLVKAETNTTQFREQLSR